MQKKLQIQLSLPVHEFVKQKQIEKITKIIKKFFNEN